MYVMWIMYMWKTYEYRIETMYFYYIFIHIYSYLFFIYNYYTIIIFPTMGFTHLQTMPNPLKIIFFQFSFTNLFYETFNSSQQVILFNWKFFQKPQTPTYILSSKKLNKNFFKVLHITWLTMWFNMHNL